MAFGLGICFVMVHSHLLGKLRCGPSTEGGEFVLCFVLTYNTSDE